MFIRQDFLFYDLVHIVIEIKLVVSIFVFVALFLFPCW